MYSKRKQAVTRRVLTWLNSRHWSHRTAIALIYWLARLLLPSCCRQGYRRTAKRLLHCLGIWTPHYCGAVQTLPKLKASSPPPLTDYARTPTTFSPKEGQETWRDRGRDK